MPHSLEERVSGLEGRTVIVTGAGSGLGRAHALLLAENGANVVVNDMAARDGVPAADEVVTEIEKAGGHAVADHSDISRPETGDTLVQLALDTFGTLEGVINNAGILRDHTLVNLTDAEWDAVMAVHLKGHFNLSRSAAVHWRNASKRGEQVSASLVHTSSTVGLAGAVGQANYAAAKGGIATFSLCCAQELKRYGVRSNCIVPAARTGLTADQPGIGELMAKPEDPDAFDEWDPANVSPLVVYLSSADCTFTGRTFHVRGGVITEMVPWQKSTVLTKDGRWGLDELAATFA
ncbi:SDR family NAD(P)-dependent oxidoreductase [Streptomyces sp. UG1]|uniref:SDR family NAD(P)-dependent oxidoreductase n=1 Tax=Streptomyces sp. UG1 TaxID=3417652 RepID=UPI003CF8480B